MVGDLALLLTPGSPNSITALNLSGNTLVNGLPSSLQVVDHDGRERRGICFSKSTLLYNNLTPNIVFISAAWLSRLSTSSPSYPPPQAEPFLISR